MPAPVPPYLPTAHDAARDILPGVRLALREKYGRVRMMVISPVLLVLLKIAGEFLMRFLADWLASREASPSSAFTAMAASWERDRSPEVRTAMVRVAAGDLGE